MQTLNRIKKDLHVYHTTLEHTKINITLIQTFIHMKPTGTPSSPALENMALPTAFVICVVKKPLIIKKE